MPSLPLPLSEIIFDVSNRAFPNGGFFVEAGAHDGVSHSNTLALESLGWSGLLVEASPTAFQQLLVSRPNQLLENVALVKDASTESVSGTFADGSLMGSAHPILHKRDASIPTTMLEKIETYLRVKMKLQPRTRLIEVKATTLDELFLKHQLQQIDLLVLDVEGLELDVLRGFGFLPKPKLVVVETRASDAQEISNLMLEAGYVLAANFSNFSLENNPLYSGDHQDYAWVSKEDSRLLEAVLDTKLFQDDSRR